MGIKHILCLIILVTSAACQPTLVTVISTAAPSETPAALPAGRPTQTPRALSDLSVPSQAADSTLPATGALPDTVSQDLNEHAGANALVTDEPVAGTPSPALTATLPLNTFVIGQSVEGRDILGWRFGAGDKTLLLVGGIHGGFEANTVTLMNEMIAYFEADATTVLPGVTLYIVPVANPDGLAVGRTADGRFNAHEVDLNRNWGCEWSADAVWQNNPVFAGERAFSEPETEAIGRLIRDTPVSAAIFYHSAANGIFAGDCEDRGISAPFAAMLGEATGYPYGQPFTAYRVTGTAASWVDGLGIPAVDLELTGTRETEFERNLNGVQAAMAWLTTP